MNTQNSNSTILSAQESAMATAFVDQVLHLVGQQVSSILLFGSRARGEARPDSDMDILVVLSNLSFETKRKIRDIAADIWLEYDILLLTLVWSESHWLLHETLQTLLYKDLQRDGIELLYEPS